METELAALLHNYKPTKESVEAAQSVKKVFLVGIAAAGKNVLLKKLLETDRFYEIIKYTTRPPRKNVGMLEKEGREYHFIDMKKAEEMLKNKEFVEAKWIHRQNVYGTVAGEFIKAKEQNKVAIGDLDVNGIDEYMKLAPDSTIPIFVVPPDFDTWQQRFRARYEGRLAEGEFRRRMHTAKEEIKHVLSKDYYSIVINDNLEDAAVQVISLSKGDAQSEAVFRRGEQVMLDLLEAIRTSTR